MEAAVMANDSTAAIKVKFADFVVGDSLELGHGEYSRRFRRSEEPFSVADEEEQRLLLNSGLFVSAEVELAPPHKAEGELEEDSGDADGQ
jgi:hypothetical protein